MSKYIDKIFYINLDKRTDRRAEIENELMEYDLIEKAERYSAIYTPHSGIVGCGWSHLNVLKKARDSGCKNVLIFEDDFQFIVPKDQFEAELTRFFESNIEYDVCLLAYIIQRSQDVEQYPFVGKILDGQTASAYLVNEHYIQRLIDLYEWALPLLEQTNEHWNYANDLVWKRLQPNANWYYFKTRIGKQRPSYSDNKMCFMEFDG